ncbi:MAG: DNA polymerase IV [Candidatus Aminicenantes bacterium]|nr:DNA polymerase IV [Candidatus Aminicenantes bacterium]
MEKERYIVHVDMDAFYAAVEQRDHPLYRGKPVVVGADPKGGKGRGVVAACSYEARKFGIHSAMPISLAYRKCPGAVFLHGDHNKYERESRKIFEILKRFSPDLEPISIDEAFLDISGSYHLFVSPENTCRKIKEDIKKETGLTASIGLAPNKMTAKIASDIGKPDGLIIVNKNELLNFLHPLPVETLWGVGKKTKEEFKKNGIKSIGDLARQDRIPFLRQFGKAGEHIWQLANGLDPREVEAATGAKSISNEYTFDVDAADLDKVLDVLMKLSEKVSRRLRKEGFSGRTITLKIRFSDFQTFTRSDTLAAPTNFIEDIYRTCASKIKSFDLQRKHVRLIGVHVSNLSRGSDQLGLFEGQPSNLEKKEKLHQALGKIKDKFGEKAIKHRDFK